jgi:hypothetical protein
VTGLAGAEVYSGKDLSAAEEPSIKDRELPRLNDLLRHSFTDQKGAVFLISAFYVFREPILQESHDLHGNN